MANETQDPDLELGDDSRSKTAPEAMSELELEIDGPGVRPSTIDTASSLEVAAAYVQLLRKIVELEGESEGLKLIGLTVEEKCAAIRFRTDNAAKALEASEQAIEYLINSMAPANDATPPPRGINTLLERLRDGLSKMPEGQRATLVIGTWRKEMPRPGAPLPLLPFERISLRAELLRVGGTHIATARFRSGSEREPFTLRLQKKADARELGQHLYTKLDIEATVGRDENGNITQGKLVKFYPLENKSPSASWTRWFERNSKGWESVADIPKELGREGWVEEPYDGKERRRD